MVAVKKSLKSKTGVTTIPHQSINLKQNSGNSLITHKVSAFIRTFDVREVEALKKFSFFVNEHATDKIYYTY